jgi:hypothetical protein
MRIKRRSNMKKERELNENKKGVKGVEKMKEKGVKEMKEKGVKEMKEKGVKEMKELAKEIETKKNILIEKVVKWAQGLCPIKDLHLKIKGRYYPLLGKETGKIYVIDKVQSSKLPFNSLEQDMQFVIASILAERKEEIEKEVEEEKRKHLEKKAAEIDKLLLKF